MHIDVRTVTIYIHIYIACIIRETIFVIIDVSTLTYRIVIMTPMTLFYPYIRHTREKRGRCGKEVSPHLHRRLSPFSLVDWLTENASYVRLFPSTVPFRSLLPLLLFLRYLFLCPIYLFLFLDHRLSSRASLSRSLSLLPFLFLVRSARESRLACRLRSTRNAIRKERTVGELPHRSSGERERGRSAGVRGRNVKESVVNRPIYCLSSLFPSSRSGQFRIFNWTTRYSLPILSLSSRFFFPVRARYRPTWLGHFTSLIWELCGEIGRSLIGTCVYIISRRAWWNSKFPIYSKKESRYRGYIVRIGCVMKEWRGRKKWQKEKKKDLCDRRLMPIGIPESGFTCLTFRRPTS